MHQANIRLICLTSVLITLMTLNYGEVWYSPYFGECRIDIINRRSLIQEPWIFVLSFLI